MNSRKRKRSVNQLFHGRFHNSGFFWRSAEDIAWEKLAPVGRKFGSPAEPTDWRLFLEWNLRVSGDFMEGIEDLPVQDLDHDAGS